MHKEMKLIRDPNLIVFCRQLVDAAMDGWEVDPANEPALLGWCYEVVMLKDADAIDKTPTRADIAANARSAKKIKSEQNKAEKASSEGQ